MQVAAMVGRRMLAERAIPSLPFMPSSSSSSLSSFIKCPPLLCIDRTDDWISSTDVAAGSAHSTDGPFDRQKKTSASVIDGKSIADDIKAGVAAEISRMKNSIGEVPGLGVVLVGERIDTVSFVRIKSRACEKVGIATFVSRLHCRSTEEEVLDAVSSFRSNPSVHGVIVQLPLPEHLNEEKIVDSVGAEKDVDGFHPLNMGNLAISGREPLFIPCAAKACFELLVRSGVQIRGKRAAVIGRNKIAGLPISLLLQRHHATVGVVHSFTKNPERVTSDADILVADAGIPHMVRGDWIKPGAVVIDMGTNSVKDPTKTNGYRLAGDVCYEEAIGKASAITPVPGGVGPVTTSMLLANVLDSAKRAYKFN